MFPIDWRQDRAGLTTLAWPARARRGLHAESVRVELTRVEGHATPCESELARPQPTPHNVGTDSCLSQAVTGV